MNDSPQHFSCSPETLEPVTVQVLSDIAGCYGTPTYAFDIQQLRNQVEKLRRDLPAAVEILYSLKANASLDDPSRIIFISSVAASGIFPSVLAYSTSKKALEHLTPSLALALTDDFIRVNAIAPGRFYSEMTRSAWEDPEKESFKAELERIPAHRYGDLEVMAGVAVMLCSRAGAYFHGEVLNLDGGFRLRQ